MEVAKLVDGYIATSPVVVFSKSYCPYCHATKSFLEKVLQDNEIKEKFGKSNSADEICKIIELNEVENGASMQDYLQEKTGQRTVPNVFINGKHIGGNSEVQAKGPEEIKRLILSSKL